MKHLSVSERISLIGPYHSPNGLYEYTKTLPFLGTVTSNISELAAGSWHEIVIKYTVGASGLADGAWIKGTFKFYSDWALFQTSDSSAPNYVSAEYVPRELLPGQTPATIQNLGVRFDQKGHERPFQKAVIVDIIDGYCNPGDQIVIRLGNRRFGGKGTRVQTFVEKDFRWRFYVDPVGTSRFAEVKPDLSWRIVSGEPKRLEIVTPRLVRPNVDFDVRVHVEDVWGNVVSNLGGYEVRIVVEMPGEAAVNATKSIPQKGWSNVVFSGLVVSQSGSYSVKAELFGVGGKATLTTTVPISIVAVAIVPKALFGDLHVHSDDTVGTEDSLYNFSYGRDIAGLDVLGYTANDFQITKARWEATVQLIRSLNEPGKFVIFPGTEWCGNSAAGGDHNVVFLADPTISPPEFPTDRHGNVARSFEWSEEGPKELAPGAWPLDEVYATYAADSETHLMIPHVGGRRCNLGWHHPQLERLVEIGSAWGQFEWLLRDAVKRGWKLGVCANSDEHRGRCGGGVPGTAVFGTRGGLTGILADSLDREAVASALRARHTFATTGPRLVAIVTDGNGHFQGDEFDAPASKLLRLNYHFFGNAGFRSIEAHNASGQIWQRDLWAESLQGKTILRITWGGARLYDRYREAVWDADVEVSRNAMVEHFKTFGGLAYNAEDFVEQIDTHTFRLSSKTSGDADGVHMSFADGKHPETVLISGRLGGYVKVGDPLAGNPHKAQPEFSLNATWQEASRSGGKQIDIAGGAELFIKVEAVPDSSLPTEVEGSFEVEGVPKQDQAIYVVGREWSGDKVITSPVFVTFQ